ncbi:uncharacterized protein LOC113748879 [Coffea eugenioides]|uniref:uncharacterized protein LOC113748879 n=1 Tax=Coffea eugenioides TaxID=49369 RepID=UPI000F61498A|nr:uncharacterized protein LOC113748879 [Coffea eugenioides]
MASAWLSTNIAATGASSITYGMSGMVVRVAPVDPINVKNVNRHNHYRCCSTAASSTSTASIYPPTKLSSSSSRGRKRCYANRRRAEAVIRAEAETPIPMATSVIEKSGIKIIKNPPESRLSDLGVRTWPKWGCPPSKFPWTYSSKETCYLLKGKVKVYPDGSEEVVEIGAGDLVEFPKGMSCTWDVSEAVDKHYSFD